MSAHIIIGSGYGDEGKGVFTEYVAKSLINRSPIVIRYNGGHQAGHTVTQDDGRAHVFSNYGSGSFQGVPTFFSKYCTINPDAIIEEGEALRAMNVYPILYVDPMAMVTTPFDIIENTQDLRNMSHGSVGVGFGKTVERSQDMSAYVIFAMDLFYPEVLREKLLNVIRYYYGFIYADQEKIAYEFAERCEEAIQYFSIATEWDILHSDRYSDFIFEGAQGILLDQRFGIFPNMTRSNCTMQNAVEMLKDVKSVGVLNIYYLTRSYSTRHGAGDFRSEKFPVSLNMGAWEESNKNDGPQGRFRTGVFNKDMFNYAVQANRSFINKRTNEHMVVSCMDQLREFNYIENGKLVETTGETDFLLSILDQKFKRLYVNKSPSSTTIAPFTIQTKEASSPDHHMVAD